MSKNVTRLFAGFHPTNYNLRLETNLETKRITGTVTILGQKIGRPSQRVTFHQKGLKVTAATITKVDKKGTVEIPVSRINLHGSFEEVRLHTDQLLYAGRYSITLTFEAPIQDSMHGAYICNYEVDGKKQQMIGTQCESHYAREIFPCIDEPEAKATFDLTLTTPTGQTSLSNMPALSQNEENDKLVTTFETTSKMSTYLLAFVIGDLQNKETTTKHGVVVRVWATKAHRPEALDFGLDVAKRAIEFFTDYYSVAYPLTKCDHVALPDFSVGAMENWGLITYRETCLLADPATAAQGNRERVALVVSHELSHQWFGDLVTMKWWDDLWLNESFANVMEYEAVDALFPAWNIWNSFVGGEGLSAIRRDSIAGVQAIKVPVHHPDEISTLFDPSIVYAKGGRLLNVLKNYIGVDDFQKGLKAYFEKHAYGNTTGDDLWRAFSEASGKDIAAFMTPWLTRSGFPCVTVSQKDATLSLSQSHFLLDPQKADPDRIWPIPLLANIEDVPALLETKTFEKKLSSSQPVQLDRGGIGHYVVHYSEAAHLDALAKQVEAKQLSTAERLMLLSDSAMLARGGVDSFKATLALLKYYANEDSEPVWDIMALIISDLRRFIDVDPNLEAAVKELIRTLIEKQYQRLGWDEKPNEPSDDLKLRGTIIALGVYAEHEAITKHALELYDAYLKDSNAVSSELRSTVMSAAIRHDIPGAFEYLIQLHETTQDIMLRDDALDALTVVQSPEKATILLDRIKDPHKVKAQDADGWLVYLLRNRRTRTVAWEWLKTNWQWVEDTFKDDQTYDHFPRYVASAFNTRDLFEEYKTFFEPKSDQTALTRNIAMGIEEIENRVVWLERDLAGVQSHFTE